MEPNSSAYGRTDRVRCLWLETLVCPKFNLARANFCTFPSLSKGEPPLLAKSGQGDQQDVLLQADTGQ